MARKITGRRTGKVEPLVRRVFLPFRIQMFAVQVFYHQEEINANSWRTVKSRDLLAYLAIGVDR